MKAIGIILAGGNNDRLQELTASRATSAMPVVSSYRAIDFSLSNMSNSGINKVAVITQYNSRSLHDHLSSAKWWDLGRKQGGIFIFTPFISNTNSYWFRGTADSIYQNISFLERSNEPYVIIASGDSIYKMDYSQMLKQHIETNADVTIAYQNMPNRDVSQYGVMELDENKNVLDFEEKPIDPTSFDVSLGIYIISRSLLIKLLETILPEARYDLVKDIIIRYRRKLKIVGYEFNDYWSVLNSIESYYNTNMDFLNSDIRKKFFLESPHIATKSKDEPPAKYNSGAKVSNALIGSGSILNGYVKDSVLFRKVFTGDNTSITDSIIMEGSYVGNNCVVKHAILDKETVVSDGKSIIGTKDKPVIIAKGTVI